MQQRPGFNLLEVAVAIGVAAIVLLALGNFIVATYKTTGGERDKTFAMQRALQMMDEIASFRATGTSASIAQYDDADDVYSFALTTNPTAVAHGELSGNPRVNGKYKYVRHIDVEDVAGDTTAKQVTVSVYYAAAGTTPAVRSASDKPLAVVSNILRIAAGGAGPTQVYDVYVISIENLPHIYRKVDADDTTRETYFPSATEARLAFEQAIRTFTSQTPGLELRTHYITRMALGRDQLYRPYVNDGQGVGSDVQKWVYFYPGKLNDADDAPRYFDLQAINGNVLEGNGSGDPPTATPAPVYAIADQFNHAAMYGAEHNYVTAGATAAPSIPPAAPNSDTMSPLSLRQFLDDMLTDTTGKYRNAIVVNLHGELFPALPLRNYGDAAKDPDDADTTARKRRLVTHPYKLNFATGTADTVRLLVHPFMEDGSDTPAVSDNRRHVWSTLATHAQDARIWVKDLRTRLQGGASTLNVKVYAVQREREDGTAHVAHVPAAYTDALDGGSDKTFYTYTQLWPPTDAATDEEDATRKIHSGPHLGSGHIPVAKLPRFIGDDLVIDLTDLDYDAHAVQDASDKYGLGPDVTKFRLHGLQYFPDPWLTTLDEANDHKFVRNTARVVVEFQVTGTGRYEVVTELRPPTSVMSASSWDGRTSPQTDPQRAAKTWFYAGYTFNADMGLYWNASAWSPSIPWSDQVQLVGDPRHNPLDDAREKKLYNPYWTDWRQGNFMYDEVDNNAKKIDAASLWSSIPITPQAGKGKGKKPPKPKKVGANLQFVDSRNSWNGVKYNAPMYFRMWREALYRNSALLVNAAGQPFGYLGLGGEFCLEGKIDDLSSIQARQGIYGLTGTANGKDETKDLVPIIVRDPGTTDWVAKPWIGELYPAASFSGTSGWESKGNLRTTAGGANFKRIDLEGAEVDAVWDHFSDQENDDNRKIVNGGNGLGGFLFNHASSPAATGQQSTQTVAVPAGPGAAWEQALQARFQLLNTRWGYRLSGGSGPEGSHYPSALVETVGWLNGSGAAYVERDATWAAARPIVATGNGVTGAPGERAFIFFASAFRPDSTFDVGRVFENAVFGMVAAYHDGVRNSLGEGAMRPMPRLEITTPAHSATVTSGTVPITVGRTWVRPDKGVYSPNTTWDPTAAADAGGPDDTIYFVKYRNLSSGTWRLAQLTAPVTVTDAAAVPGDLPASGVNAIAPARTAATFTASWTLPNTTTMPDGEYLLRVEGYRLDQGSPQKRLQMHQAYHEVKIVVDR